MTTQHRPWNFIAGDDFFINIQLLDASNNPYNSQNIEIKWLLHNPSGEIVPHDYLITHVDAPNGRITVWIPSAVTTNFIGGAWVDWIRIVCNGIVSTLLTGVLNITADPWRAPVSEAVGTIEPLTRRNVGEVVVVLERERIVRKPKPGRWPPVAADVVSIAKAREIGSQATADNKVVAAGPAVVARASA